MGAKMLKETMDCGVMWRCADCGHQTKFRTSLFEHCESKHIESSGHLYQYCQKYEVLCKSTAQFERHLKRSFQQWLRWRCGRKLQLTKTLYGDVLTVITLLKTREGCLNMSRANMWEVRATRVCIVVNTVRPKMPWEAMFHETTPKAFNFLGHPKY